MKIDIVGEKYMTIDLHMGEDTKNYKIFWREADLRYLEKLVDGI
ncbi:hypothetical protein [Dethiothermospora halolimnae]